MHHQTGEDRNQLVMFRLESSIAQDAFVGSVDAFVDCIDLKSFGFSHVECKEEGRRPPYQPSVLLKLYLYGYHYGIHTSRKLEREAQSNLEAIWLLSALRPRYKTIANFRKDHRKAFREVFRRFVCLLKEWSLIEGETIAIDSFKIRGSNSLKKNFNEGKLKQHLEYIDAQIEEYERILDTSDDEDEKKELHKKLEERKEKQEQYKQVQKKLADSGEQQISLTDPDSRAVILLRNIVNVGYNIQASSDSKYKLFVEYDTGEVNDSHALSPMAISTKELINVNHINVLADKGYHTGEELAKCQEHGITTFVSPKAPATKDIGLYPIGMFVYNREQNFYTCPQGHSMKTNGTWHRHSQNGKNSPYRFQRYNTPACKTCAQRHLCTKSKTNGRYIDRSEYAEIVEANALRVAGNPGYYKKRQQITEHPFGTLKRQRGYTHTNLRGKENVLGELGIVFIGYNLGRCISILGVDKLINLLRDRYLLFFKWQNRLILSSFNELLFPKLKLAI